MTVLPCTCGTAPTCWPSNALGYYITCDDCYDGATDALPQQVGTGNTYAEALDDWNAQVKDEP